MSVFSLIFQGIKRAAKNSPLNPTKNDAKMIRESRKTKSLILLEGGKKFPLEISRKMLYNIRERDAQRSSNVQKN